MRGQTPYSPCRAAALAAALVGTLLLAGCWGISPVERLGLVTLVGIDALPQAQYQVTLAILNPLGQPTPQGATAGGQPELLRSASASSVAAAIRRITATSYLQLDFTHVEGVVVSERIARQGLAAPLEFMQRDPEFVTTPWLYVARGESAADVLRESEQVMPDAGIVLAQTTLWSRTLNPDHAERLFTFLEQMQVTGDEPATVGVSVDPAQGKKDTVAFRLAGVAMFRGDRLVGWLDGPGALGWLVATGRARRQTLIISGPGRDGITLELLSDRRRIQVVHTPSGPEADIQVRVKARVIATQSAPADYWRSTTSLPVIKGQAATVIDDDVRAGLRAAQSAGADVFTLGQYVRVQDPMDWRDLQHAWNTDGFRRLPVSVHVELIVRAFGKNICPLIGPC